MAVLMAIGTLERGYILNCLYIMHNNMTGAREGLLSYLILQPIITIIYTTSLKCTGKKLEAKVKS